MLNKSKNFKQDLQSYIFLAKVLFLFYEYWLLYFYLQQEVNKNRTFARKFQQKYPDHVESWIFNKLRKSKINRT